MMMTMMMMMMMMTGRTEEKKNDSREAQQLAGDARKSPKLYLLHRNCTKWKKHFSIQTVTGSLRIITFFVESDTSL
jgi:hypothetical protein